MLGYEVRNGILKDVCDNNEYSESIFPCNNLVKKGLARLALLAAARLRSAIVSSLTFK